MKPEQQDDKEYNRIIEQTTPFYARIIRILCYSMGRGNFMDFIPTSFTCKTVFFYVFFSLRVRGGYLQKDLKTKIYFG